MKGGTFMGKTIIISEDMAGKIKDSMLMTQFKFNSNIKRFLAELLEDPVNCQPDPIFAMNGIDKNKLIKSLSDGNVIVKKMNINDHDADGNPHTAMMTVKYSVPKERFQEKLDALYDTLFPDVEAKINEEGGAGGGAASCSGVDGNGFGSGEFIQPLFGVKRRKIRKNVGGDPYQLDEAVTGEDGRKSSAVYAYAKNRNGEWCVLAAKRNKNKWDDEGGKMNPPMGHRHKYESAEDGAVRECEEESGIKFDKKDLVLASKEDWGTNFKIYLPGKTSDYKPGEGDEENNKFRWIPVSEIGNYEWAWSCGKFAKKFSPKSQPNQNVAEYIEEATATGTGGLPGEFDVPVPFGDKETLDRMPGNTCGMHNRVGNSNLGEAKQTWRDNPLFTIGKYKGIEKAKVIREDPDYCLWLYRTILDEISNCPFSPVELAMLDVSYYRKHKVFPIRSIYTPKYAKINGKYVSEMTKEELEYVYQNGNDEFKWLVTQEHKNRGWVKRNWYGPAGAPAFQSDDVGDDAWMNKK